MIVRFEDESGRRDYLSADIAWILLALPDVQPTAPGAAIDLNGTYLAPSSRANLTGAVATATTHPRGDRRGEGQVYEVNRDARVLEGTYTPFSDDAKKPLALGGADLRGRSFQCKEQGPSIRWSNPCPWISGTTMAGARRSLPALRRIRTA